MKTSWFELPISTRNGEYLAHYSEKGLAELDFPNADGLLMPKSSRPGRAVSSRQVPLKVLQWHSLTAAALKKMLAGLKPAQLPPLDWSGKTDFQKSVWRAMLKISPGKTKSYGEIAAAIG